MSTCLGTNRNGDRCGSPALADDNMCFWHSRTISEDQRKEAARKGALVANHGRTVLPPDTPDVRLDSPEAAIQLLQENVSRTQRGELDIKVANSIAYQVTTAVRVWEVAISAKLNQLEKLIRGRRRRR